MVSPHWELDVNAWLTTLCTLGEKTLGTSKCRISSKPPFPSQKEKKIGLHGACCITSLLEQKQISKQYNRYDGEWALFAEYLFILKNEVWNFQF